MSPSPCIPTDSLPRSWSRSGGRSGIGSWGTSPRRARRSSRASARSISPEVTRSCTRAATRSSRSPVTRPSCRSTASTSGAASRGNSWCPRIALAGSSRGRSRRARRIRPQSRAPRPLRAAASLRARRPPGGGRARLRRGEDPGHLQPLEESPGVLLGLERPRRGPHHRVPGRPALRSSSRTSWTSTPSTGTATTRRATPLRWRRSTSGSQAIEAARRRRDADLGDHGCDPATLPPTIHGSGLAARCRPSRRCPRDRGPRRFRGSRLHGRDAPRGPGRGFGQVDFTDRLGFGSLSEGTSGGG